MNIMQKYKGTRCGVNKLNNTEYLVLLLTFTLVSDRLKLNTF